jgi:hypothetical protein
MPNYINIQQDYEAFKNRNLMKTFVKKIMYLSIVLNFCILSISAQTEGVKEQLFLIDEVIANPAFVEQYESGVREFFNQANLHNYPYKCYAWSTLDLRYIYVYPAEYYTEIDHIIKSWDSLAVNWGLENWQKISKHWTGTYQYAKLYVIRSHPDLSFIPVNPYLNSEEIRFVFWDCYHVIPGEEKQMNDLLLEWKALLEDKNIKRASTIFTGDRGTEMPVYIIQFYGKDIADFWSFYGGMWDLLGADGEALFKKLMSIQRKREIREFQFRPDLSYLTNEK